MERRRSVLLADANEEFRTMLRDAMEETGLFTVELACNGHEVLERIHTHEPELLVLDPALPGTDGIRCGKCEKVCPQHLHIRDLLADVAAEFEKKG